ncbi:MAG: hypothetical protein HYY30_11295 [Chloroflexi bacterium]|nr:hypothetical protein [Chloroflexota bacterium]
MSTARTEELAKRNFYDELIRIRDQQRKDKETALFVVKGKEIPWELNPQGIMRWYMHPEIDDTATKNLIFFVQQIPPGSCSGLLKFQGGQVIHIIEGKGHTVIDGVKIHWEGGDVLQLPLRKDGVVFQHFNDDPHNPVELMAAEANLVHCVGVDRGCGFEQLASCPEYKAMQKEAKESSK